MSVSRAERQCQFIDTLLDLAARHDLGDIGIREVAAAAGVAIGTVQYAFPSKDDLLFAAYETLSDRILARLPRRGNANESMEVVLRRAVQEFVPLDAVRVAEARVYFAFLGRALASQRLAEAQARTLRRERALAANAIRVAQAQGEIDPRLDPDREARLLAAMIDGLSLHALSDPDGAPPTELTHDLDRYLDRLFVDWRSAEPTSANEED